MRTVVEAYMGRQKFAASLLTLIGLTVLAELSRWTSGALRSLSEGDNVGFSFWAACLVAVFAATAITVWMATRSSLQKANLFAFSVAGIAISLIGSLAFYIDVIMSAQAVFYRSQGASQSLLLARVGLAVCAATFIFSAITLLRTAWARR